MTPKQRAYLARRLEPRRSAPEIKEQETRFVMISGCGEGAQTLARIQQEGNPVALWIEDKGYADAFDGILPKTKDWRSELKRGTVFLFDTGGMGEIADKLRASGFPVFGASKMADVIESDREAAMEFMEQCGIQTPANQTFTDFNKATSFLESSDDDARYVFKPHGTNGDVPAKKLTYVASDKHDLIRYLQFIADRWKKIKKFDLQQFVEGVAISSEIWCDGEHIMYPMNHTVENKKYAYQDMGPSTGCSGNIVWQETNAYCSIMANGVDKCRTRLLREGYIGNFDLNAIVNKDGVWGLEFTPRFGLDSWPTTMAMMGNNEVGKLLADVARGQADYDFPFEYKFGSGLRVTVPPYPLEPQNGISSESVEPNMGIPIRGIDPGRIDKYYFYEVKLDPTFKPGEDDQDLGLVHSGGTGLIFTAVDADDDVDKIFKLPYELAEKAQIPNKHFRTDLEKVLLKDYRKAVELEDGE